MSKDFIEYYALLQHSLINELQTVYSIKTTFPI